MSGLPATWVEAPLDDLFDFNPKHSSETPRDRLVSFVPMPAVDEVSGTIVRHECRPLEQVWKGYTHFQDGDIIFAKITPCMENGKVAVANHLTGGLACGSTEFHVLRSKGAVDATYAWRFLRQATFRREAEGAMTGAVGQRRVPLDYLKKTALPVPPANEQIRIVTKLDRLAERSSCARDALDRIPKLIERYKQAILAKAFSGELTADWREKKAYEPPIAGSLEELLSAPIRNGLSVRGSDNPPGIRSLRLSALRRADVDLADIRYLPISDEEAQRFLLSEDDILISRGNGTKAFVGISSRVGRITEPTIFPDTAFRVRPDRRKARSRWLSFIWNAPQVRRQIEIAAKTTAGIWKISQSDLNNIKLFIPDVAEQDEIVLRLDAAFSCLGKIGAEHSRAVYLLSKLDQTILSKAFRGKLVPQEPNDEPASALLERITKDAAKEPSRARRGAKRK